MHVQEAEMHGSLHSAASGFEASAFCGWIYVKMVSGYWFWSRVRVNPMLTGSSSSGSYGVRLFPVCFLLPFMFQVFLSSLILPPVLSHLFLIVSSSSCSLSFSSVTFASSISRCFAWFLSWLWAGLDTGESCIPTVPTIKLLKHFPIGFPVFWILSVVWTLISGRCTVLMGE